MVNKTKLSRRKLFCFVAELDSDSISPTRSLHDILHDILHGILRDTTTQDTDEPENQPVSEPEKSA